MAEERLTRRGGRGILTLAVEVLKGKGGVVQDALLMVRTRAAEHGTAVAESSPHSTGRAATC